MCFPSGPRTRETVVPQFWPLGRALWAGDQKAMVSAVLAIPSLRQELENGFLLQLAADTKRVSADRQHLVRQCSRELLSTDQWGALYNSIPRLVKLVLEYITNLHTKGKNVSRDALWYRPRLCVLFGIIMNCVNKDCIFIQCGTVPVGVPLQERIRFERGQCCYVALICLSAVLHNPYSVHVLGHRHPEPIGLVPVDHRGPNLAAELRERS